MALDKQNEVSYVEAEHTAERNSGLSDSKNPYVVMSSDDLAAAERKLLRKLDLRLIPWLTLLYLMSFLDRTNIGNAAILGLPKDLGLSSTQWSASLAIFFVSYSIFEPVSNVLLKRLKPSFYIPAIMILWGIACICQGLVSNFAGLAATRWFLGMFEAGLFPGCQFYLSCWYRRSEFGFRSAVLFSAAALAGSFGGLLATAIGEMHGIGGKPGWAWIFILEGCLTVAIAVVSFWMVYDFPDEAKFLSAEERLLVYYRLRADQQASAEHEAFKWSYVKASLIDWKTWTSTLIYMGCGGGLYAFSLFLPTIIAELGYTTTKAQLLTVPPYAVAAIVTVCVGFIGDRYKQRGIGAIGLSTLASVGFAILLGVSSTKAKYAATFLAAIGIYPCIPNTISWVANNTEGVYKRGITLGVAMGWANLQGVVISNVYRREDAPRFVLGHAVVLGYLAIAMLGGSILHYVLLRRENRVRRSGAKDHLLNGKTGSEIRLMGDQRPDFLYTL